MPGGLFFPSGVYHQTLFLILIYKISDYYSFLRYMCNLKPSKRVLILIAFCCMNLCMFSQEENDQREIGIDGSFINQFIPLSNTIGLQGPYIIYYQKIKSNGAIRRLALDLDIDFLKDNDEDNASSTNFLFGIDSKFGIGKRKKVHKNIYVSYGTDILMGISYSGVKIPDSNPNPGPNSSNSFKNTSFSLGTGPFLGLQYYITSKFSFQIETSYYLVANFTSESFKSEQFPSDDFNSSELRFSDLFSLPSTFVIYYNF